MRQKVQLIQKRAIKRILEYPSCFESYVASLFFRAYAMSFDPHTVYLSKADRDRFEAALSTENLSFGIDLDEKENGDIEIARITPGGPAWKSNELHKGDILTSLKWQEKDEIDLAGADIDEVEALLETPGSGKLEITVRKTNGALQTVALIKEKLRADENIVKSFILKGDKKIGYISLPGFYTEWENASGQGCANDVAKEIVKLKHEGIEGLILDIRFNGGGSLTEGINLAGIFINEGPLCVIHDRGAKPSILKDNNRGTIYDGPLLVMVNGQSASASEILAATLQDYNRAIIVGTPTFGKSTGQIILPLDTSHVHPVNRSKPNLQAGYAKVTVSKLYRVTGNSAQLKGVKPDVLLPDIYQNFNHREAMYPFALSSDSVARKIYYAALPPLPLQAISQKSIDRIASHPAFATVKKLNETQPKVFNETSHTISLDITYLKSRALAMYNWYEAIEKVREKKTEIYTVENTRSDKELLRMDTYGKEINDHTLQSIQHSFYIEESYKIIGDLIQLQRNK
jgi:carboxyl-terminal processing protease